jgi:hypothetical protein
VSVGLLQKVIRAYVIDTSLTGHSRNARSVRVIWLLDELGVPYVVKPVEFKPAAMKSADISRCIRWGRSRRSRMARSPCSSRVR